MSKENELSLMLAEALESADVIAAQFADSASALQIVEQMARLRPSVALTVARGSSDHAAAYFSYLLMTRLGLPSASLPPSVMTQHHAKPRVAGQLVVAFSQSGQSPDLVETMAAMRELGATGVAMVNAMPSPLAQASAWSCPVLAGPEKSVAATKSFIGMLGRSVQLVAGWERLVEGRDALEQALRHLPSHLCDAASLKWSAAVDVLASVNRMLVIGRGAGLAVALEAALKLKETSGIQAEAFSAAEVRHGPMEIIRRGYPVLIFAPAGVEQPSLLALADELRERGARVLVAAPRGTAGADLPLIATGEPLLDPITTVQSFYVMAAQLAAARGRNPDEPQFLKKVTKTL
jgi:glutamine---fructose-6-phosphate transaminase (isomerizing)